MTDPALKFRKEKAAEHVAACFRALALHVVECGHCDPWVLHPQAPFLVSETPVCDIGRACVNEWRKAFSTFVATPTTTREHYEREAREALATGSG